MNHLRRIFRPFEAVSSLEDRIPSTHNTKILAHRHRPWRLQAFGNVLRPRSDKRGSEAIL
eukprot:1320182-Amorphochlora_amoeboformis.AAC.1